MQDRLKLTNIIKTVFKSRNKTDRTALELTLLSFPLAGKTKFETLQMSSSWVKPSTVQKLFAAIGITFEVDNLTDAVFFSTDEINTAATFARRIIKTVYPRCIPTDAYSLFDEEVVMPFGTLTKKFEPPNFPSSFITLSDAFKSLNWDWNKFRDWIQGIRLKCYKHTQTDQLFFGYDDFCDAVNNWLDVHNDELNADSCVDLSTYETNKKVFDTFARDVQIFIDDYNFVFPVVNPIAEFNRIAKYTKLLFDRR